MRRERRNDPRLFILLRQDGERSGINRVYRLYREEGLTVRKRRARRRAAGSRGRPILVESKPNARWSVDFVHDQLVCGRRLRILNIVDDVTRECLAAIPDTSISPRAARELTALIKRRGIRAMTRTSLSPLGALFRGLVFLGAVRSKPWNGFAAMRLSPCAVSRYPSTARTPAKRPVLTAGGLLLR